MISERDPLLFACLCINGKQSTITMQVMYVVNVPVSPSRLLRGSLDSYLLSCFFGKELQYD